MSEPWNASPPPPPPPAPTAGGSNRATTALVLGIIGLVCCPLCAPFAWVMGNNELKAIQAGQAPTDKQGVAMAGKVLGIIGTIVMALWLLWIVAFGGLAVISALSGAAGR